MISVVIGLIVLVVTILLALYFSGVFTSSTTAVSTGSTAGTPPPALTGTQALELGKIPMAPWGGASNFVDNSAVWIWNVQDAVSTAPLDPVKFSNQYYNSTGAPIDATLHVIVDDKAKITLNGNSVGDAAGGWADNNYSKLPITLASGNNLIDITATNEGGPAALIVSLVKKSDGSILLRSDGSWVTSK